MHIPENYLSPSTCAVMTAAMLPVWTYSIKKVKAEIPKVKMPLLGIGAAFSFLGMISHFREVRQDMQWEER